MKSIWTYGFKENKKKTNFKKIKTDICIIGGGMAGMSTAFQLRDSNLDILLIDKGTIGFGATAYTTAKISYLQELPITKITSMHGEETAKMYYNSQKEAFDLIAKIIEQYHIDCDYQIVDELIVGDMKKIKKEELFLKKWKVPYQKVNTLPLPFSFSYGIGVIGAVFHPLKYLYALKELLHIPIYENVLATAIQKKNDCYWVTTDCGIIEAKYVVVATHYPFFVIPGLVPFKTHIEKSYVIAAEVKKPLPLSFISTGTPFHSVRYHENYILYGSYAHALMNDLDEVKNIEAFQERFQNHFKYEIKYTWFNQDLIPNDGIPLIGEVNKNLYIATGFHTWGMTNGTIAGKVISDCIVKGDSIYKDLFSPKRSWKINRLGHFFVNGMRNAKAYLETILIKNPKFYQNHVCVTYENGKRIGIYLDELGVRHKVLNTCPHMKCKLIFNEVEKTWDCPCHSSRFDIDGNIIRGPSKDSIRID